MKNNNVERYIKPYELGFNEEKLAVLKRFPRYGVSVSGKVYNLYTGKLMKFVPNRQSDIYNYFRYRTKLVDADGNQVNMYLNQVVALAWLPVPYNIIKPEVDHIDHDTSNNAASNLRWVDHKTNMQNRTKRKKE